MMYKQTRDDNEGRGLQALFPVGMNLLIKQDDVETIKQDDVGMNLPIKQDDVQTDMMTMKGEDYRHSFQ